MWFLVKLNFYVYAQPSIQCLYLICARRIHARTQVNLSDSGQWTVDSAMLFEKQLMDGRLMMDSTTGSRGVSCE